jgi:hypothetical protein
MFKLCSEVNWPPLWSSGQSSWLQIQRSGFDSQQYQIFRGVVGLERGPLSLVSTTEELLGRKNSDFSLENVEYGRSDPSRLSRGTLYLQKVGINFTDKRWSLGRYSSLADSGHGVSSGVFYKKKRQAICTSMRCLHERFMQKLFSFLCSAVVWGTMLQAESSRFLFPIRSLVFFFKWPNSLNNIMTWRLTQPLSEIK